jgi:pyruvate carboxylase
MMRGDLGQPPSAGWPKALAGQGAQGREAYTERPGSLLPDADLDAERAEIETKLERPVSENEFASYLMYPKVFTDFALATETYGPVSMLPTPAYFYGLPVGGELFVEIEKGKTLVLQNLAESEPDDKGMVTVFFELNGQPRRVKVPDRAHGASGSAARRKAEAGNEPMSQLRCRA